MVHLTKNRSSYLIFVTFRVKVRVRFGIEKVKVKAVTALKKVIWPWDTCINLISMKLKIHALCIALMTELTTYLNLKLFKLQLQLYILKTITGESG